MYFLVFLVFLFAQYYCKEQESQITFTVSGITKHILPCLSGSYTFNIEGEFSSSTSILETLTTFFNAKLMYVIIE